MEQLVGGKWGDSIFFTPCESQHDTLSLSIKEMVGSGIITNGVLSPEGGIC